jgi:hypothetical protein
MTDPRVPRAAYEAGQTYGQRANVLLNGIYDACPGGDVTRGWEQLPEAHRSLFVVYWAVAETYNGGVPIYFFNTAGDFAPYLPAAARYLGADAYADLFDRAIALFDIERLPDRRYRQDRLEEMGDEPLDRLDDEFYALEDAGDVIWATLLDYVEAHPETFFTDG